MDPIIELIDTSISYAPKFRVSWKVGEYKSVDFVYTAALEMIIGYTSSWTVGQIPGISISACGDSVSNNNSYINAVNNGDGTYSYYFRLSGTPTTKGFFDVRNSLLPPQIHNGMWFNFCIVDEYSDSPPSSKTHQTQLRYGGQVRVSISSAIQFLGATWSVNKQKWDFEYRMAGIAHTANVSGINDRISFARILLNTTYNQSHIKLWPTPNDPEYLGSTPASSTNTDYSGVATAVIGLALSVNYWASLIWGSVSAIVSLLANRYDGRLDTTQAVERSWTWWPFIRDTSQFFWFDVLVDPNETVEFSYDYAIVGNPFEVLGVTGYRRIYAGSPGRKHSMNPTEMTAMEREQCGIVAITREELLSGAFDQKISGRVLKEWLDSDDDVFFYSRNFQEGEVSHPASPIVDETTSMKDLLSAGLSKQVEICKLMIEAFHAVEKHDVAEAKPVIEKYSTRLRSLLNLQEMLESNQYSDSFGLSEILDQYISITTPDSPPESKE